MGEIQQIQKITLVELTPENPQRCQRTAAAAAGAGAECARDAVVAPEESSRLRVHSRQRPAGGGLPGQNIAFRHARGASCASCSAPTAPLSALAPPLSLMKMLRGLWEEKRLLPPHGLDYSFLSRVPQNDFKLKPFTRLSR